MEIRTERHFPALRQRMDVPISRIMRDSRGRYNYISNSVCYQLVEDPDQFYQSGNSFGHFLKQLGNYPASSLKETIPDFHNTVKRFENLEKALKRDIKNRAVTCRPEIAFALDRKQDCKVLVEQQENGTLPLPSDTQ